MISEFSAKLKQVVKSYDPRAPISAVKRSDYRSGKWQAVCSLPGRFHAIFSACTGKSSIRWLGGQH